MTQQKKTITAASADDKPGLMPFRTDICPVELIARHYQRIIDADERAQVAHFHATKAGDHSTAFNADADSNALFRLQRHLATVASYYLATSLAGAMFQTMLVHFALHEALDEATGIIASFLKDEYSYKYSRNELQARRQSFKQLRAVQDRNLFSILCVLERASGTSRSEVAGDYFMAERLNPFQRLENCLAGKPYEITPAAPVSPGEVA